ncbi:MAG TPA: C13 family peptidase [Rhizomicrobium sp.]
MIRFLLAVLFAASSCATAQAGSFSNWAAIVVAGDHEDHNGNDSEVFDNARRDIAASLVRLSFAPANIAQFSTQPKEYASHPRHSDMQTIATTFDALASHATAGCFAYVTSHGAPEGIWMDDAIVQPKRMAWMLDAACGNRPTIVIVSSCFSGAFVPDLAQADRFVFTAARSDRTSFGCGQGDKYTFFDQCFLQSLPDSHDFPGLAERVKACVSAREIEERMSPPSEPQLSIGADVAAALPHW